MKAALVLRALPARNVMVGIAGVFVGAVKDQGMSPQFQTDGINGLIGQTRTQPKAGQSIALAMLAAIFIVLEECQALNVNSQFARQGGVHVCRLGCHAAGKIHGRHPKRRIHFDGVCHHG